MLQWLIDSVVSRGKGLPEVVRYMMLVNFAAIHTSSNVSQIVSMLTLTDVC